MNRVPTVFVVAASLIALAFARPGFAEVDVHVNIGVPPPPAVVFDREPQVVLVPSTQVYYLPGAADYDMYRFGPFWYINRDGYWYRARGFRGPFRPVAYVRVPRQIVVLPVEYRHHPPRPRRAPVRLERERRRRDREH
jgi:hypothetical protein